MSHESTRQQAGSAVFHEDRGAFTVFFIYFDSCASLKMFKNSVLGLSKGCLRLAINC